MATIKAYTDIEQSKKLAEILPIESADYTHLGKDEDNVLTRSYFESCSSELKEWIGKDEIYPCWSLTSLLDILPKEYTNSKNQVCTLHIDIVDSETPYLMWYANPEHEGSIVEIKTKEYSNLIDACYEMVLKLHESNML